MQAWLPEERERGTNNNIESLEVAVPPEDAGKGPPNQSLWPNNLITLQAWLGPRKVQ